MFLMKKKYIVLFALSLSIFYQPLFAQQEQTVRFANGSFKTGSNIKRQQFKKENIREALFGNAYFVLIQFDNLPGKEVREKLLQSGIHLQHYLPGNAYLAQISSGFDFKGAAQWGITSINVVPAAYKISPEVNNFKTGNSKKDQQLIVVGYAATVQKQVAENELQKAGAVIVITKYTGAGVAFIQANMQVINSIAAWPFINSIAVQSIKDKPLNNNSTEVHGVESLNAVNGKNLNGKGVTIGIGDNADISTHADFSGRLISRTGWIPDDHGTHVSGTIAGAGIVNIKYRGMAAKATIIDQFFSDIITSAPTYVTDNNMVLTNNSYYSSPDYCAGDGAYDVLSSYIDLQMGQYKDLLHVVAAGNDGSLTCNAFPAAFGTVKSGWQSAKNVLTVGAMNERDYTIANFSSRGPVNDGRIKPEITANGWAVVSTRVNNTYGADYGTSMAAPAVAGALALLEERYRQLNGGITPPAALLKALVCNTAEDLGNPGPDYTFGFGMLEAARAVDAIEQHKYTMNNIDNGASVAQNITVPVNTKRLKVMLYWPDTAAAINASAALVNDLDITVTTPGGITHFPLILNSSPASVNNPAVEGADHINNIEQVVIENPAAGNYTINVKAYAVPFGPQQYVLSYETLHDEVVLQYPAGGETLVPGETEKIRWLAYGNEANTFTVEYSDNNGATWSTLNNNVPATSRLYAWTIPAGITSKGLIKVTRNGSAFSGQSNFNFSILGQPVVTATNVCTGAVQLNWSDVTGAISYDILQLQSDSMKVIGNTTATSFLLKGINKNATVWLGVAAKNGAFPGRRSISVKTSPNSGACTLPAFNNDLLIDSILTPNTARQRSSTAANATAPVKVLIKNLGALPVNNPFTVSYSYGNTITTETVNAAIAGGGSYEYTFTGAYPIITAGYRYDFKAWVTLAADSNHINDTAFKTVKSINNDPVVTIPLNEGFETMANTDFVQPDMAIGDNKYIDFSANSAKGRARTFVNTGFARSGSRSLTLDQWPYSAVTNVDSVTLNYNLVSYAADQLRFDFYYFNHGQGGNTNNKVWIRGSENDAWLPVYDLFANQAALGNWKHGLININEALAAASPRQAITETFQIKMGEEGNTSANDVAPLQDVDDGYTFDDLSVNRVFGDLGLSKINSPDKAGCGLTTTSTINVTVKNFTDTAASNITVSYQVNNGPVVTEIIPAIAARQSLNYTFTKTADMSAFIDYAVKAWIHYTGDTYPSNDSIMGYSVHNSPLISTYPYLENFENSDGNFYSDGTYNSWQWGVPAKTIINKAPNGTKAWVTGLTGNYNNNETSYLYTPCFDLSSLSHPVMSFSHIFQVEKDYDFTWIEYSTNGVNWQKLGTTGAGKNWYDNLLENWNISATLWHVASIDLPVTGTNIRFRFVLSSDGGVSMEGIGIDDVTVHEKSTVFSNMPVATIIVPAVTGNNWIPFQLVDSSGQLSRMAEINPNGQDLGKMTITVYPNTTKVVRNSNDQFYLDRNYVIHPSNPPTGSVGVRLYFTDDEADSLINASGCTSCTKPSDAYELGVTKFSGLLAEENGVLADDINGFVRYITPGNTTIIPHGNGYYAEFSVNSFSEFWFNNGGTTNTEPLPVNLFAFEAVKQSGYAFLSWKTADEVNVAKFDVERSVDGRNFSSIGSLSATNATVAGNHNYTDSIPLTGINYYRIKVWQRDGTDSYSVLRKLDFSNPGDDIFIYPNPVSGGSLFISADASCSAAFLYDRTGKLIKSFVLQGTGNTIQLNGIAKGVYMLKIISANSQQVQKILVQ